MHEDDPENTSPWGSWSKPHTARLLGIVHFTAVFTGGGPKATYI